MSRIRPGIGRPAQNCPNHRGIAIAGDRCFEGTLYCRLGNFFFTWFVNEGGAWWLFERT